MRDELVKLINALSDVIDSPDCPKYPKKHYIYTKSEARKHLGELLSDELIATSRTTEQGRDLDGQSESA